MADRPLRLGFPETSLSHRPGSSRHGGQNGGSEGRRRLGEAVRWCQDLRGSHPSPRGPRTPGHWPDSRPARLCCPSVGRKQDLRRGCSDHHGVTQVTRPPTQRQTLKEAKAPFIISAPSSPPSGDESDPHQRTVPLSDSTHSRVNPLPQTLPKRPTQSPLPQQALSDTPSLNSSPQGGSTNDATREKPNCSIAGLLAVLAGGLRRSKTHSPLS